MSRTSAEIPASKNPILDPPSTRVWLTDSRLVTESEVTEAIPKPAESVTTYEETCTWADASEWINTIPP